MNEIKLENINDNEIQNIRKGLISYKYIQNNLCKFDDGFKNTYFNFYLKTQPLIRKKENRDKYFGVMQSCNNELDLEKIIIKLKEKLGVFEFSFATKMLHTYHNEYPIYDSKVKEYLNSIENGVKKSILKPGNNEQERLQNIMKYWEELQKWYKSFMNSEEGEKWINWFDKAFPDSKDISNIKKIDFIIYGNAEKKETINNVYKKKTIQNILKFRDDRDWKQYHNGKDLAISISLEANELLANYQWSAGDIDRLNKIENIKEELADVIIYSVMLADYYNLDLDKIINDKLEKNLVKYPNDKKIDLSKK